LIVISGLKPKCKSEKQISPLRCGMTNKKDTGQTTKTKD